jgi:hypothetical protein
MKDNNTPPPPLPQHSLQLSSYCVFQKATFVKRRWLNWNIILGTLIAQNCLVIEELKILLLFRSTL